MSLKPNQFSQSVQSKSNLIMSILQLIHPGSKALVDGQSSQLRKRLPSDFAGYPQEQASYGCHCQSSIPNLKQTSKLKGFVRHAPIWEAMRSIPCFCFSQPKTLLYHNGNDSRWQLTRFKKACAFYCDPWWLLLRLNITDDLWLWL